MNSQGSGASNVKILQSQNRQHAKIRLSFNGLPVVHGRHDKLEADGQAASLETRLADLKALIEKARPIDDSRYDVRARIAMRLRSLIAEISIDPGIPDHPDISSGEWDEDLRGFAVTFANGQVRGVFADRNDPQVSFTLKTYKPEIPA